MKTTIVTMSLYCIIILLLPGKLTAQTNIDKDIVAYFPFNGDGNGKGKVIYNATVKRARLCADKNGKENSAYSFNGSDSYIRIDSISELDNISSISICAWIYPRSYDVESYTAWISKPVRENYSQFRIGFGREPDTKWGLTVYDTTWNEYYADNHIPLNKWSFVVYTIDATNGTAKAFINSKEVGRWQNIKKIPASKSSLYFGYQLDDRTVFDGILDEIRIYSRALNQEEIEKLYDL